MKACLILWDIEKINKEDIKDSFIVGVDLGSYNAISHGIIPDIAIGDFEHNGWIVDKDYKHYKQLE